MLVATAFQWMPFEAGPMSGGLLPEEVRKDIEDGVADALNEPDLRAALSAAGLSQFLKDWNEVELVTQMVLRTHGEAWDRKWREGTFFPYVGGYIVQTIQLLDLAAQRLPRELDDRQREQLDTYQRQVRHENG